MGFRCSSVSSSHPSAWHPLGGWLNSWQYFANIFIWLNSRFSHQLRLNIHPEDLGSLRHLGRDRLCQYFFWCKASNPATALAFSSSRLSPASLLNFFSGSRFFSQFFERLNIFFDWPFLNSVPECRLLHTGEQFLAVNVSGTEMIGDKKCISGEGEKNGKLMVMLDK